VTVQPDHLTDEVGAVLTENLDERVYFVRSKRWIAYPKAVEILGHLNALLKHPRTTRMPSLAVYGDSGMGKSMLVEKFKDDYGLSARDRPDGQKTKVLVVEMAGRPNERRLYAQILAVIGAPQNPRATIVELERTAVRLLGDLGVQVLVLDEIHNVLAASWREQRVVFNTLRYLSNELKLSLVCFGNHGGPASDQWRRAIGPSLRRRLFASMESGERVRATRARHRPQLAIERTKRSDGERSSADSSDQWRCQRADLPHAQ
jgi:Cdc6-like AAA superfamily ATPase